MPDFPAFPIMPLGDDQGSLAISTYSGWGLGPGIAKTVGASAWPSANRAIFVPIRVPKLVTVTKLATGTGTGTTGNFDLGIYDAAGNKIVSTGSQAKTTATSERIIDITDTVLLPGMYYLAMSVDGTGSYLSNSVGAPKGKILGTREMASAFALPATATFATRSDGYLPSIAAYLTPTP